MATCTSKASGDWSAGSTWDTDPNPPANGDTVIIANTHTVTFDVDMSGWANGVILTINAGGTLTVKDDAGAYYLKSNAADITNNGNWTIGTSIAVPFTGTFTVDFNGATKSIEVGTTGHLYWYCENPTYKWIYTTGALTGGVTTVIPVDTDVTGDIWADGDNICIVDTTATSTLDCEVETIAAGGIAANQITITAAITNSKNSGSLVGLVTRNIRVINFGADNAITYATAAGTGAGDYIGAELSTGSYGISYGDDYEFAGTTNVTVYAIRYADTCTMSGCIFHDGTATSAGFYMCWNPVLTDEGLIAGVSTGASVCKGGLYDGLIWGCIVGINDFNYNLTGNIKYCNQGISGSSGNIYGDMTGNAYDLTDCMFTLIANVTLGGTTNFLRCISGAAYNTSFNGTEFSDYTGRSRTANSYWESSNHDQVENAYKAWCRGGIVTSQTASPPTGYTIWYEHACEDTTGTYPCFRQYETTVLPGTAIEVYGKIRIADGEDMTGREPALQIIDKFADPLVDDTQNPLDEDEIPLPTGEAGWQDVSVIWANAGDAPRQVIVRMIAWCHAGGATEIDSCWSIATYQDQIAAIYNKLPTNYIMGSSVQSDKDDEIDAILVDTDTTIPGLIATAQADLDIITGTNGVLIDDDAIKSSKFDESTAFPVKKADTGSTEIARTGEDGDTLETLSDQLDEIKADTEEIISNTGRVVNVYPTGERRVITGGSTLGVEDERE